MTGYSTISKACFIGGTRYSRPLDSTQRKKFRALSSLATLYIIAFSRDRRPGKYVEDVTFYLLPSFPSSLLRYLVLAFLGFLLLVWCTLRYGVDCYIAQSPYEGAVAAFAKRFLSLFGKKVVLVVEAHSDFETSLFMQRSVPFAELWQVVMRRSAVVAFSQCDILRSISDATRQQLAKWAPNIPVVQFPAWTDMEAFLSAGEKRPDIERKTILYTGVLIPRKGVIYLLQAFDTIALAFPEARLKLVGTPSNREYTSQLKSIVHERRLQARVEFVSQLTQTELARVMSEALVFVLPSISEGLGRVVFEAMATGTPVIGTSVDGIPDMIIDGETGLLVPPRDVEELVARIRWVFEHPDEALLIGKRARLFAQQFFSTDRFVCGYEQIFALAASILRQE